MQQKICATCFYDTGDNCKILHEKINKNCYAWADEAEAKRREGAIKNYIDPQGNSTGKRRIPGEMISQRTKAREDNLKKRGGKSVNEILDEHFLELYEQDMTDIEIGEKLGTDNSRVCDYRRSKGFASKNKKDRPALTETAM